MVAHESSSSPMAATPADTVTLHGSASNSGDLMPPKQAHTDAVVDRAREEFNALERSLTSHSKKSVKKTSSNDSSDVEKAAAEDEEERFDLREYLTSSNDANQEAGIKHKVR